MKTKYSDIPTDLYCNYINKLIDKFYKIIPLKESNCVTTNVYIDGLIIEISGFQEFIEHLNYDARILTILNILNYIQNNELSHYEYRRQIFKCINFIKQIQINVLGEKTNNE